MSLSTFDLFFSKNGETPTFIVVVSCSHCSYQIPVSLKILMQKYNQRHHFLSSLRLQQFSGCVSTFVTITVKKSVKEVGNLFKSILHSDFCTFVQTLNNSFFSTDFYSFWQEQASSCYILLGI